jgi:phosphate transport system ATP-binding protein
MNDVVDGCKVSGKILLDGKDIYAPGADVHKLRACVGMVFQKPNLFPQSIRDNVLFGLSVAGKLKGKKKPELDAIAESLIKKVGLTGEIKSLDHNALDLSGGQQQRLCIARAIACEPEVLLMDEPCSALDPISTGTIENLIATLRETITIVMVTHNLYQAKRASDYTVFLYAGEIVEQGETGQIFMNPKHPWTNGYITGDMNWVRAAMQKEGRECR